MDAETLISKLNHRYATKAFDPNKKIPDSDWKALEECLRLSPSSYGLQPWKFIVVRSQEMKEKLKPLSFKQSQITDCSHLVVICTRLTVTEQNVEEYVEDIINTRGISAEEIKGFKDSMLGFISNPHLKPNLPFWAARQGYIALGFILEAAAVLGIDACPMEGFDSGAYNEALGLKDSGFTSTVLCAAGYRSEGDQYQHAKKVRFAANKVIEYR